MKSELKILDEIVENTVQRYKQMLKKFKPAKPEKGEFLEQNLITNFAIEFAKKFPESDIYTEIPFQCWDEKNQKNYWKCRADMFIINGDKGYIIEAKGSQRGGKLFSLIEDDINRIQSPCLQKSFMKMKIDGNQFPKDLYGIIIADFWGDSYDTLKNKIVAIEENQYIKSWNPNDSYILDQLQQFKAWQKIERLKAKNLHDVSQKYPYWFLAGMFKLDWNNNAKGEDCIS